MPSTVELIERYSEEHAIPKEVLEKFLKEYLKMKLSKVLTRP